VYAELTPYEVPGPDGGPSDSGFFIAITHANGVVSHLYSSKVAAKSGREYRVDGDAGVFMSAGGDPQAAALYSGKRPVDDRVEWGIELEENWGTLYRGETAERVPAERGDWTPYYEQFAAAVQDQTAGPVPASDAVEVLRIIDAARASAATRSVRILDGDV
jgi:predicted dehydrogenase